MFPRPLDKRRCHFPFDWRTSLLSSRDSFIPAARTCSLRRADRIQVATMSHIIPLYLELASEIPTPVSFLCPFENHHNITKHVEPIPSRPRCDAAIFASSCLVLLTLPLLEVLRSVTDGKLAVSTIFSFFYGFLSFDWLCIERLVSARGRSNMDFDSFLLGGGGEWEVWGLLWLLGVVGGGSPPSWSFMEFVFPDKM